MTFVTSRKIGRPPLGMAAMSGAERQRRHRAKLAKKAARQKDAGLKRQALRADYDARACKGGTVQDLMALAAAGEQFGCIYADPPWSFETYSGKGKARSADRYYDTSLIEAIKSLPVAPLAARDCALFLWCTMPNLPAALDVIAAWGFTYKTVGFIWVKENRSGHGLFMGLGYWSRSNAELCLLATRGAPMRMAMDVHQIVMATVGAHSAKPQEVRARIERLLVGPYLELYGRTPADGWVVGEMRFHRSRRDLPDSRAFNSCRWDGEKCTVF